MGLEAAGFSIAWANDIEPDKRAMYANQFGVADAAATFHLGDVRHLNGSDIPNGIALAWASFPCTDVSLAGSRRGLAGQQSGTFWEFSRILDELGTDRPTVVALENVVGLASSHGGRDLRAAIAELNRLGYSVDVMTLDARRFVPQSRPRLFMVGCLRPPASAVTEDNDELRPEWLGWVFRDPQLRTHRAALGRPPALLKQGLAEAVEVMDDDDERWWDERRTTAFLSSLSVLQAERLRVATASQRVAFRTAYRRTRGGIPVWEIRSDEIAGCLRTARGGSSRQAVVRMGGGPTKVRWMTPTEYARLMGADQYRLDGLRTNQALFGFGDAVCVPVVTWLAREYLLPAVTGMFEAGLDPATAAVV